MGSMGQERLIPLVDYSIWKGIDNLTTDDMRLKPGFVRVANNIDFDDEDMPHRRVGISRLATSGSWHSIWSDGDQLCFGVLNGNLVKVNTNYTTTTLLVLVGLSKMNFVKIDERVFFSNNVNTGYIKDSTYYAFPEADRTMRQKMVGGSLIEYYNGRLYAVQGNNIYFSVAYSPMEMEEKRNFITLDGPITMMHSVEDGIYISAGNTVAFHHGSDLFEMKYKELLSVPATKGSPIIVERLKHQTGSLKGEARGKCVIFSTSIGIFMGEKGGTLKDLTGDYYGISNVEDGSAIIRWDDNYRQYVFMAQAPAELSGMDGASSLPLLTGTGN